MKLVLSGSMGPFLVSEGQQHVQQYDDNILSRLIMIIIKIIILYFIPIGHTDVFPSTSIPANSK